MERRFLVILVSMITLVVGLTAAAGGLAGGQPTPPDPDAVPPGPSSTILVDSPLFVSADFPAVVTAGSTVTLSMTCSRPHEDRDNPSIDVFSSEAFGIAVASESMSFAGNDRSTVWEVPADQPEGDYTVRFWCDGLDDNPVTPFVYPPGAFSPDFTLTVVKQNDPSNELPEAS